jgi:hypothetical protein
MDWAYVLVIILSIFLALFLFLGIVLVVLLIRVTAQIKRVTESAERTATNIEGVVSSAARFATPSLLVRNLLKQAKKFRKGKN